MIIQIDHIPAGRLLNSGLASLCLSPRGSRFVGRRRFDGPQKLVSCVSQLPKSFVPTHQALAENVDIGSLAGQMLHPDAEIWATVQEGKIGI
jgi:hypothetical protein